MAPEATLGGRVVVIGSVNVDYVVRVPSLPRAGQTVIGTAFERHDGGKGANQAVAAARLGADVTFVGAVGDDDLGASAVAGLRSEGVDARVVVVAGAATGVALICVDDAGQNQIAVAAGANAQLDGARVDRALAGLGPRGVLLASFEIGDGAVLAGASFAARHGVPILVSTAPARPVAADLLALSPVLVANAREAEELTGERDPRAAALALASRARAAIVTLGEQGALVAQRELVTSVSAPAVVAVDTTGAGDAFAGALAAELAAGSTLLDAAGVAVRAASLSVTSAGARAGMPKRDQLAAAAAGK